MKLRESAKNFKFSWINTIWIGLVHLIAFVFCWQYFTWAAFISFIVLYYVTGMVGITFGFHRYLTHKGFKLPNFLQKIAAVCGTLACQGGPISWVGSHRLHHAYSDTNADPHDAGKGFWHSHIGYIFMRRGDLDDAKEVVHYCPDLAKDSFLWFLEKNMIPIQFVLGFSLIGIGGVLGSAPGFDWYNGISVMIWGIFVRLVALYHATWFVNSATHKWGTRPHDTNDSSRNNWWVALLAFGEGWHNNHHAQPRSARHGWHWWQFDITWIFISVLKFFGFIKEIKLPVQAQPAAPRKIPTTVLSSAAIETPKSLAFEKK